MRALNVPPSRRSTQLLVVCQSSWGAFHCRMSDGVFQAAQTSLKGALTAVSTVIFTIASPLAVMSHPLVALGGESSTRIFHFDLNPAAADSAAAGNLVRVSDDALGEAGRRLGARGL